MSDSRLTASGLRDWAHTAVGALIVHADEINRLNVFPVADADTGTNMLFTMRSALAEAEKLPLPEAAQPSGGAPAGVADVAAALAQGGLRGARGNSGVILSQILRGVADVTAQAGVSHIDGALFAAALTHAADLVVASMGEEVDGTVLSVLRAAAAAATRRAADGEELPGTVVAAAEAAVAALDKTPEQLDVLADAGVVDAGGRGLLVLLDALSATLTGHAPNRQEYTAAAPSTAPATGADRPPNDERPPHYEVMYQMSGCRERELDELRGRLEALGESVAIAGDGSDCHSVHVHADDAGAAVEAALDFGKPSHIQISLLRAGAASGRWTRRRAVLAVVEGQGAEELFAGEGAHVLRREGAAAPISASELQRALVDTGAGQVMVLPNGFVAAEELVAGCTAASGWGLDAVPVPTASMVQGLAALAVHEPARAAVDDGYAMTRAAGATRHGSVRRASEQALTWAGMCRPGDGLGIAGDEVLVVGPDVVTAATGLLDLMLAAGGELVTILTGADADDGIDAELETHVRRRHRGIELAIYRTGHRGDALLIGVE